MKTLIFTGGHHTSSLVVAKTLKNQGWNIVWFGHRHTSLGDKADSGEFIDVTKANIEFVNLKAGKLYRSFHIIKLLRIPYGFFQAYYELLKRRQSVKGVVSFGGYLAVPTVLAAKLLGIPVITHEQTVVGGWANKLIGKYSQKILLTWPESQKYYKSNKTVIVGLPLRPEVSNLINKTKSSNHRPVIYITGGKQGSHVINKIIFEAIDELCEKYTVIHQTGNSTHFNDSQIASEIKNKYYEYFSYGSEEAVAAFEKADVVIGRSGAHTCYELGILGKKSVLIPIPWSSHDEQYKNAQVLEKSKIAVILPQNKLDKQSLLAAIENALSLTPEKLDLPLDANAEICKIINNTFK